MLVQLRKQVLAYWQQIFAVNAPKKQIMHQIFNEITQSMVRAYREPEMKKYIQSLSVQSLLNKSVQYYVGSKGTPRNEIIMQMLMNQAESKAKQTQNQKLSNIVYYYRAYYIKMGAIKNGDEKQYDNSSSMFMQLAQKGDQLSNYLVGKQMYKMMHTGQIQSFKNEKAQNHIRGVFINSLSSMQYGGLYYIADLQQKYLSENVTTPQSQRMIYELYSQAASLGYSLAYFKISLMFKKKKNNKMYKKYLLIASEAGVIEAQHNLAIQYAQGEHFPKDQIKAVAWFMNAAAHGFIYSKYNLSRIMLKGSSCGRLKPNNKAALIYLQQINRSGQIDVSQQIKQLQTQMAKQ